MPNFRRRIPLAELKPRRVCLIKPSALGDIVQTLPVLAMLRQRWPDARLDWVVNQSLSGILQGHPEIDSLIEFDRGSRRSGISGAKAILGIMRELRRGEYDLAIDLQGLARSGLMITATGAGRRVGMECAREGSRLAYTDRITRATFQIPAWQRYVEVARGLGCTGPIPPAKIPIRAEHRLWAAAELAGLPRPLLAISPGAQWETKRWSPGHFLNLARRAQSTLGAGIVLVGGPDERPLADGIARELSRPVVNLSGRTSLLQLAAVCEASDVFLSGDTGPMHLAAALGTPPVSVFTCTSPIESGPREFQELALATRVPCAASYLTRCPKMVCCDELLPARVWPILERVLRQSIDHRRAG